MKKLYFLFTCIMFLSGVAHAQCPSGDYAIVNTEDVDNYIQNYGTCTSLPGRLRINSIQDLSFLSNVTSVAGALEIANSPGLTLLTGLENLTSVGGNLLISDLTGLTDLDALSGLVNTGGDLSLYNLPEVTSLDGLSGLTSIGGGLSIEQLPLITNLNGLSGLTSVGTFINVVYNESLSVCNIDIMCEKFTDGSIPVVFNGNSSGCNSFSEVSTACNIPSCPTGSLTIASEDDIDNYNASYSLCTALPGSLTIKNITDLSFLNNVTSVAGDLVIVEAPDLVSLAGLDNLVSTGGTLSLFSLPVLQNLDELSGLTSIGGGLSIDRLPLITNLNGLSGLTSIGTFINVVYNESLSACNIDIICEKFADGSIPIGIRGNAPGCNNESAVANACNTANCPAGDITIASEDDIDNYNTLYSVCTALPGSLYISNITDLSFLNNVTTVAGNLVIEQAPDLVSLAGLDNLVSVGGDLQLDNIGIADTEELVNLTSVGGTLSFQSLPALQNLTGLSGLTAVPGSLSIDDNNLLTDISGLSNIISVGGSLSVNNNAILPSLTGLGAVATVDGALSVFNNPLQANLDALSGLQILGGDLALGNLPLITSLNGLANIGSLVGQVVIVNNPLLTTCAIQPICDRLEADGSTSFTVFNNATGCNDTDEIEVDCLALPVTLVNFEAVIADDGVLLTWRTTVETNSEHFEVQRSVNAKAWSVAGIVQARGESQDVIPYSFKDQPVYDGLVYYRLKMVDLDSGFAYSPIVSVAVHSDGIVLFPNPADEVLNIRNGALHAIRRISVTDLSGIMLYVSDKPVSSIPLKGYKPGLYLITITYEGGEIHQKKILVSR